MLSCSMASDVVVEKKVVDHTRVPDSNGAFSSAISNVSSSTWQPHVIVAVHLARRVAVARTLIPANRMRARTR